MNESEAMVSQDVDFDAAVVAGDEALQWVFNKLGLDLSDVHDDEINDVTDAITSIVLIAMEEKKRGGRVLVADKEPGQ